MFGVRFDLLGLISERMRFGLGIESLKLENEGTYKIDNMTHCRWGEKGGVLAVLENALQLSVG